MPDSREKQDLRALARTFFDVGVKAADPALAVRDELARHPMPHVSGRIYLIAIGKAAVPMMKEALLHVPEGVSHQAVLVTNYENACDLPEAKVFAAGHPVPDENGLAAGQYIAGQLSGAGENDLVLCLISGGGSALLPAPVHGISLEDKVQTNAALLASGLDIQQMNLVRQNLSLFKGGGLSALARPAKVRALIISDVIGDDPRTIASGPTASKIGCKSDAIEVLEKAGIWNQIPTTVRRHLSKDKDQENVSFSNASNSIIASNRQSLDAILSFAKDWNPFIVNGRLDGDVFHAANEIVDFIIDQAHSGPQLLIWGGETTVKLKGTGRGGRNQELALRFALEGHMVPGNWVFLSGGTDGRDGPTEAAGGIVTPSSIADMIKAKVDLAKVLENNDSYQALSKVDSLLTTGPTGTNVADIQLFLRY